MIGTCIANSGFNLQAAVALSQGRTRFVVDRSNSFEDALPTGLIEDQQEPSYGCFGYPTGMALASGYTEAFDVRDDNKGALAYLKITPAASLFGGTLRMILNNFDSSVTTSGIRVDQAAGGSPPNMSEYAGPITHIAFVNTGTGVYSLPVLGGPYKFNPNTV